MTRLGFVLGALALVLAFAATRAGETNLVAAQSATPAAEAGVGGTTGEEATDASGSASAAYQDFLASFAANLGLSDPAQVDVALRTTLKQEIDERQAAGDLTVEEADAIKGRIDAAEVPLGFGGRGRGPGGFDGHGGFGGFDDHGGFRGGDGGFHGRDDGPGRGSREDDRGDRTAPGIVDDGQDGQGGSSLPGLPETPDDGTAPDAAATPSPSTSGAVTVS